MADRFSKQGLAAYVYGRIHNLEMDHNFNRDNGYAQVTGKGEDVVRAYGEFRTLLDVAGEFRLLEPPRPAWWLPYQMGSAGRSRRVSRRGSP